MYIINGNSEDETGRAIGIWYAQQVNKPLYGPFGALGFLDKDGNMGGAAIFLNYNSSNIELHVYGPGCMTRQVLKAIMNYVFSDLKCNRLTAIERRSNKQMLRILPRLGFIYEAVLVSYFGPDKKDDGIVFRITPEQASKYKWIV